MGIIENKRICNFTSKGPNYRESKTINWKKVEEASWKVRKSH